MTDDTRKALDQYADACVALERTKTDRAIVRAEIERLRLQLQIAQQTHKR